jgi:hypothetical protein
MTASSRGVEVFGLRLLQVLWLEPCAGPAAGAGAVEAQRPAQGVRQRRSSEQALKLPGSYLCALLARLEQAPDIVARILGEHRRDGALRQGCQAIAALNEQGLKLACAVQ